MAHLFQPENPTCTDYALRVAEMLAALAAAEGRSESAILADLCAAGQTAEAEQGAAGRTDWMEPEYGLRRPELALVLDLAACRVERATFVLELERLQWPRSEAAELADLVAECELTAAESAAAGGDSALGQVASCERRPSGDVVHVAGTALAIAATESRETTPQALDPQEAWPLYREGGRCDGLG